MGEAKRKSTVEGLQAQIAALRAANEGMRQRIRELDAKVLRQQAQFQGLLARSQASEVELRIAVSGYSSAAADAAEADVKKHAGAGQVEGAPKQG